MWLLIFSCIIAPADAVRDHADTGSSLLSSAVGAARGAVALGGAMVIAAVRSAPSADGASHATAAGLDSDDELTRTQEHASGLAAARWRVILPPCVLLSAQLRIEL